jgi:hypothetical protein
MNIEVLDPTHESRAAAFERPVRPGSLAGATVGFVSNGKEGTRGFFAHLERMLRAEFGVAEVVVRTKANYSAPAEPEIVRESIGWDLAIAGLGD